MTPTEINSILEIPEWDTFSAIKNEEASFIYDFVKKNEFKKTLEIGFAFAKSASHIIAASNSKHLVCDPFQNNYNNMGLTNIEKLQFKDLLEFYPDYSHNILPLLLKENRNFEFIFIDGDHKFDGILVDFYYADLLLNKDGYVLLHDTWMRSTRLVESFIKTNRKDYKHIKTSLRNFSLFQKVGTDDRNGMYFREFYTLKSILAHSIINWMTNGKNNLIKSMLFKFKELIK